MKVRRAEERGVSNLGWLRSKHTFSFGEYFDHRHMGYRALRVLNDDWVAPGRGFGMHAHRNMEIISYVVSGALTHRDSIGSGSEIGVGEIQRMSAGRGIRHSEFNASEEVPVHFLQIWLEPSSLNLEPSYEQVRFDHSNACGQLLLLASDRGAPTGVTVHQDMRLYVGRFDGDQSAMFQREAGRHVFVHIVSGELVINRTEVRAGDAVYSGVVDSWRFHGGRRAEILLFDLS